MNEEENDYNYSAGGGVVLLVVLIAVGWWAYNNYIKTDYSKPWWTGTATQEVCGTENLEGQCSEFQVYSDGEYIKTVILPNGLSADISWSECYEAASFYDFDRFCRAQTTDGLKIDVNPGYLSEHRKY